MTAVPFKPVKEAKAVARVEAPAPVQLPEVGKLLNVMLGMLLLIMLSSVVWHFL